MGLVSKSRERVDVPYEKGEWIELQALSGFALESARRAKMQASIAMMQDVDLDRMKAFSGVSTVVQTPQDMYDHDELLRHSIVAWSYADTVNVGDLDARTRNWLVDLILDRNGFLETEAERKN